MKKKIFSSWITGHHMDYLLNNGFGMEIINSKATAFSKNGLQLLIVNDHLILKQWHDGDDANAAGYREINRINEISNLDDLDWKLTLHVLNIQRMSFIDIMTSASEAAGIEAQKVLSSSETFIQRNHY